jgi:hypothetical protein
VSPLTYEERVEITRLVMEILEGWGVKPAAQVRLLALPDGTKPRAMKRYHEDTPLPDEPEVWQRVEHLAGIADALRTSYPRNGQMGNFWMNRSNNWFDGRTPVATMVEDGLDGVIAVRAHLDCAFDWDLSGSKC